MRRTGFRERKVLPLVWRNFVLEASLEGAAIAPSIPAPRKTPPPPYSLRTPRTPPSSNPISSSDPIGGGRFTPGQIIAERYRAVALAGRGGMGEVYRAEDLNLGQVVAPKSSPRMPPRSPGFMPKYAPPGRSLI